MDWVAQAKKTGFDAAILIDPQLLTSREDVRAMCAADRCRAYNQTWTCPPACGTIEECQARMRSYERGILLQSIGHLSRAIDSNCYRETERRHTGSLQVFAEHIRSIYPTALCLGAGSCRVCEQCAYPQECRFPEKAMSSMEGYGLFVTQVCRDAGIPYYYRERTIAYTACVLF